MTIIEGISKEMNPEELARKLKKKLACGGTYKNGRIELQGDHREKLKKILTEFGFNEEQIEVIA
jgi:translation initiation factor 1